jgi:hypothetical protein
MPPAVAAEIGARGRAVGAETRRAIRVVGIVGIRVRVVPIVVISAPVAEAESGAKAPMPAMAMATPVAPVRRQAIF